MSQPKLEPLIRKIDASSLKQSEYLYLDSHIFSTLVCRLSNKCCPQILRESLLKCILDFYNCYLPTPIASGQRATYMLSSLLHTSNFDVDKFQLVLLDFGPRGPSDKTSFKIRPSIVIRDTIPPERKLNNVLQLSLQRMLISFPSSEGYFFYDENHLLQVLKFFLAAYLLLPVSADGYYSRTFDYFMLPDHLILSLLANILNPKIPFKLDSAEEYLIHNRHLDRLKFFHRAYIDDYLKFYEFTYTTDNNFCISNPSVRPSQSEFSPTKGNPFDKTINTYLDTDWKEDGDCPNYLLDHELHSLEKLVKGQDLKHFDIGEALKVRLNLAFMSASEVVKTYPLVKPYLKTFQLAKSSSHSSSSDSEMAKHLSRRRLSNSSSPEPKRPRLCDCCSRDNSDYYNNYVRLENNELWRLDREDWEMPRSPTPPNSTLLNLKAPKRSNDGLDRDDSNIFQNQLPLQHSSSIENSESEMFSEDSQILIDHTTQKMQIAIMKQHATSDSDEDNISSQGSVHSHFVRAISSSPESLDEYFSDASHISNSQSQRSSPESTTSQSISHSHTSAFEEGRQQNMEQNSVGRFRGARADLPAAAVDNSNRRTRVNSDDDSSLSDEDLFDNENNLNEDLEEVLIRCSAGQSTEGQPLSESRLDPTITLPHGGDETSDDEDSDSGIEESKIYAGPQQFLKGLLSRRNTIRHPVRKVLRSGDFGESYHSTAHRFPDYYRQPRLNHLLLNREMGFGSTRRSRSDPIGFGMKFIPNVQSSTINFRKYPVVAGQFSRDGSQYFAADHNLSVLSYDTTDPVHPRFQNKVRVNTTAQWMISDISVSYNGSYVAISSLTPIITIVNSQELGLQTKIDVTDIPRQTPQPYHFIFGIDMSANADSLIAGSSNGQIYQIDMTTTKTVRSNLMHLRDVNSVKFADDTGRMVVSGSDDGYVRLWDLRDRHPLKKVMSGHSSGVTCVAAKGDGNYFISNSKDQTLRLWDIRTVTSSLEISNLVASSGYDYRNNDHFSSRIQLPDESVQVYRGHEVFNTLIRCDFSPAETTGQQYIYSGSSNGYIHIWHLDGTPISHQLPNSLKYLKEHDNSLTTVNPHFPRRANYELNSANIRPAKLEQVSSASSRQVSWHPKAPCIYACLGYNLINGTRFGELACLPFSLDYVNYRDHLESYMRRSYEGKPTQLCEDRDLSMLRRDSAYEEESEPESTHGTSILDDDSDYDYNDSDYYNQYEEEDDEDGDEDEDDDDDEGEGENDDDIVFFPLTYVHETGIGNSYVLSSETDTADEGLR